MYRLSGRAYKEVTVAIVRVQLKRTLTAAPALGTWDVYTGAWFQTSTVVPTGAVQTQLLRLFNGLSTSGGNQYNATEGVFSTVLGATDLRCWSWSGGVSTLEFTGPLQNPNIFVTGPINLPPQTSISVGYRRPLGAGENVQKGRSRFFLGPLKLGEGYYTTGVGSGLRLTDDAVNKVVANAKGCIEELSTLGWVLQVKSGTGAGLTFDTADEIYADDVLDVNRSRRGFRYYQRRDTL